MPVVHERCCGLDVHKATISACVLVFKNGENEVRHRQFATHVAGLANEIHRVLEDANIKLSCVATDVLGATGQAIVRGIVKGHTDPGWLADYAKSTLRSKKKELELVLRGHITDHHRWMLAHLLEELDFKDALLDRLEEQIQTRVEPDAETIALLETIPGVGRRAAWTILSEFGNNVEVFGSAGQLASWAGLAPGNYQSAGQRRYVATLKGNRHLRRLMVQCAWAATRVKDSYLGAFFRRVMARRGHLKALVAVAHKLVLILFQILKKKEAYKELGGHFYDQKNVAKVAARTVSRLEKLGFEVVLTPKALTSQAVENIQG